MLRQTKIQACEVDSMTVETLSHKLFEKSIHLYDLKPELESIVNQIFI